MRMTVRQVFFGSLRWMLILRGSWPNFLVMCVLQPATTALCAVIGLESLPVADRAGALGDSLAPGVVIMLAVMRGSHCGTYPVFTAAHVSRSYVAFLTAPTTARILYWNHFLAALALSTVVAISASLGVVLAVTAPVFSVVPLSVVAVLCSWALVPFIFALSIAMRRSASISLIYRCLVTPVILLSGALFPIALLPPFAGSILGVVSPVARSIELYRLIGDGDMAAGVWSTLLLLAIGSVGCLVAGWSFNRRLVA
jgi:hypothetical protein